MPVLIRKERINNQIWLQLCSYPGKWEQMARELSCSFALKVLMRYDIVVDIISLGLSTFICIPASLVMTVQ